MNVILSALILSMPVLPSDAVARTGPVDPQATAPVNPSTENLEPVVIEFTNSVMEGGDTSMQLEQTEVEINGQPLPGLVATAKRSEKRTALYIPAGGINATKYNTFEFRVKFDIPDEALHGLEVRLFSPGGQWAATTFGKHSTKLPDGSYLFSWDIINQPDRDYGINLEDVQRIGLAYDYSLIPEDAELRITLSDMKFIAGRQAEVGDPALYAQWQKYIANYEPDYSDSSHALQPPTTGRIATPLRLTENGQALAEIVIEAEASAVEVNAANELQLWIKKISGAELPIVNTATQGKNTKLLIGKSFTEGSYAQDIAALDGSDGYAVRTEENAIYIFGAEPKGTMNGVFAFIENNSDIIWARPHPDYGTVFSKNPNFTAVWGDACDRPLGELRGNFFNAPAWDDRNVVWADRNRNNFNAATLDRSVLWGNRKEGGGGHNLQSLVPKEDPQYYPTVKGKKPDVLSIWEHQICMSVPGLAHTIAQNVITGVQSAPSALDAFNVKIEDNWGVCECADCTAPIKLPDGETISSNDPAFRSTQFYMLLNAVTEEVNRTYANLKLQTYAYFFTAIPPKVALHHNITVLFCPYIRKDHRTPLYSPVNDHWWRQLKGFAKQTPNVFIREYYGIMNEGRPLAEVVAADFKSYLDMGVKSIGAEMHTDIQVYFWDGALRGAGEEFDLNMMDYWVLNRIYWNPNADVEGLRKYFLRRTFHEAAPHMEKFFGVIRKGWYGVVRPPSDWGNFKQMLKDFVIAPGKEEEMRGYLAQAAAVATHPVSRVLIARLQERFSKTISQIHNPAPPDDKRTPAKSLHFGWSPGKGCNIYPTTIELNGSFVPALRVTAKHPINPYGEDLICDLPHDLSGLSFKFTVIPVNPPDSTVEPKVVLMNRTWKVETAPVTSYSNSSVAPGAMEFTWTPSGMDDKKEEMDLTQGGRLILSYDRTNPVIPPEGLEYYFIGFDAIPTPNP